MKTLWDLIEPVIRLGKPRPVRKQPQHGPTQAPARRASGGAMQARYDEVVEQMLAQYQIRVRKWRTGMTGIAWYVTYKDGRVVRLIEAPRPKGPMSAAVFLHEVGHHAIGFSTYKPRCLEEYHAWAWALRAMDEHKLNITEGVRRRMHLSLWYAVAKAKRRGIREVPPELHAYLERPVSATQQKRGSREG